MGVQLVGEVSTYVPLRDAMIEMGMLYECSVPDFPPVPWRASPFGTPEEQEAWREFSAAREVIRSARGPGRGIPAYKVWNKGQDWLVLPEEIAEALERAPECTDGRWGEWLGFLRRAQQFGGFRVN
jgi:hypothetical protein